MLYIRKFDNGTDRERYLKTNFVSPHLFMNAQNRNVNYFPKYKRLSYISSTQTGGQYIDLGCHLLENTDDIRIDIKFNIKDRGLNSSNQQGTLLCSQPEVNPYPGFVLRYKNQNSARTLQLQTKWNFTGCYYGNSKGQSQYLTTDGDNNVNAQKLDNNIYEFSEILDNIPSSQINDCTCTLFCALDGSNNPFRYVEADLYYLRLLKGNNIVRNLIPVQRMFDNKVGLWDLENQVFYTSQGNEPFVAGIE